MTVAIQRVLNTQAYDLIFPDCLAKLSEIEQAIMKQSMTGSTRIWLGCQDDKVLCVWGLIPPTLLSDTAYLWMFETPHLREHVFLLVRHSQRMIAEILRAYPTIIGHCKANQRKSIRWLRWLGAEFGPPVGTLIPFTIKAPV